MKYENICEIKTFIVLEWNDMTDRVNEELKNGWVLLDIFPLDSGVRILMGKLTNEAMEHKEMIVDLKNKLIKESLMSGKHLTPPNYDSYSEHIAGIEKRIQEDRQHFRGMANPPRFNLDVDTKRMMGLDNMLRTEVHEFNMSYGLGNNNKETNNSNINTDNNYSGPSGYKNLELLKLLVEELIMSPRTILRAARLSRLDELRSSEEVELFTIVNNTLKTILRAIGREMYLHDTYNQLIAYLESIVDE